MSPEEERDRALRTIAALTVRARRQTDRMGRLSTEDASAYLCDVEHALAGLIAWGAVPGRQAPLPPGTVRGEVLP